MTYNITLLSFRQCVMIVMTVLIKVIATIPFFGLYHLTCCAFIPMVAQGVDEHGSLYWDAVLVLTYCTL
jgi:hypothetical protein